MERLHNQENAVRKSRAQTPQQQTIIVHNDEEALATLQCRQTRPSHDATG
jgi:hypothetical protein